MIKDFCKAYFIAFDRICAIELYLLVLYSMTKCISVQDSELSNFTMLNEWCILIIIANRWLVCELRSEEQKK